MTKIFDCPYEIGDSNQQAAVAACLAAIPLGATIEALPLPPLASVHMARALENGVRVIEYFVPFPKDGEPRLMGRASVLVSWDAADVTPTDRVADVPTSDEDFAIELRHTLNCYSRENASDTPDFILAQYLLACLDAWNRGVQQRETWYGRER